MTHPRIAGLAALACLLAPAIGLAQTATATYPQVYGPGGQRLTPAAETPVGVLADGVTPCVLGQTVNGGVCQPQSTAATGATPVAGAFTATGPSATFFPVARIPFNISIQGTFSGTVELDRYLNGAWQPVTVTTAGTSVQLEQFTAPASDQWLEPQAGVAYRLNATAYGSGTVNYSLSQ